MSKQKKIIGFAALAIAMFIGTLDSTIINIALPDIMDYFKSNLNDTSWISTIYVLGLSVFMIPASKLADQFGRKKIMLIGLVLFGGSSALCGLSTSLLFLISMRLIQGMGGAIITPIVVPMALDLFGREKTQKVAGTIGAVTALAAAGGPPIGGLFIKYLNWQSIFFINVPFVILSILLTVLFINESYDRTLSKKIDILGILFLTAALFLLTFALLKGGDFGWDSKLIISMFVGSAASLILFILTESKVKAPLVNLGLFRESTFTASVICYLITGFGIVSPLLIFNYFLQNALGYEALNAALIIMSVSLTVIISMPLGSMVAGKFGARPVNFLGVVCMGTAALMLSRLTVTTSKSIMIADMIIFGFGLGFSCQSLVSSIKHLPEEKSGIGSGVVNAARQVGTCIGIALLVSVLNNHVTAAKIDIKNNAVQCVNQSSIVNPVKETIIHDIDESLSSSKNNSNADQKNLERKLESDVKEVLASVSSTPRPSNNDMLGTLYDGAESLSDGAGKLLDGQKNLDSGINSLSSGLTSLNEGDDSLTAGISSLDQGLAQALSGSHKLKEAGGDGIEKLTSGASQLNDGSQKLLSQFSSGEETGTQTIYDGITGIADGSQTLADNVNDYVSAVINTYFLMIKNDSASPQLLKSYQNSLLQTRKVYDTTTSPAVKIQLRPKVKALNNLVALYKAGTDPTVTNKKQFEAKLARLAAKSEDNQNVVASGKKVAAGAEKLAGASQTISEQFGDGGAFKSGMEQVADGISKLNQSSGSLNTLQTGFEQLSGALSQLKSGSEQLVTGSIKLQSGISSAKRGSEKLCSGSSQLIDADKKIKDGAVKLTSGVGLLGQADEIQNVVSEIKSDKDTKIAGSFDQTFLLSAIILMAASVCGLFTDRKDEKKES